MKGIRLCFTMLILFILLLLAGCASGTAHMTVKKDGGLDLAFSILLDARAESMVGGKLEEVLTTRLTAAGIQLNKSPSGKSTKYEVLKSYDSFEDMQANAGSLDIADTQVVTADKWLYTKYDIVARPKLNAYSDQIIDGIGTLNMPKSLARLLMQSLAVNFKLTLPYDLYGANNAVSQEGNTLTWRITLADSEPLRLVVYVPDIKNILVAGGGLILILAAGVLWFIRSRKSRNALTQ
ncbi:hypothetical protein [Paenibacillus ihuae]|uniref:hypothetical protein n=1 Tax=Paenibacillus ihuae TaxID=1232431 RepID=UPI000AABC588|nr:hypothetical protein [Paenibacillus ihuae]